MNKALLVLRHEIITVITRPSFIIVTLGLPLTGFLLLSIAGWLNRGTGMSTGQVVELLLTEAQGAEVEGYVDLGGLVRELPPDIAPEELVAFPDELAARQALMDGEIEGFYIIPADYIATGALSYVRLDFNPLTVFDRADRILRVLLSNMLEGDFALADRVERPLVLEYVSTSPEPERDEDNLMTFLLPYLTTILFYVEILGTASLLLASMTKEKENRLLEMLMVAASPLQILTGKLIGLGLVGLLQTGIWITLGRGLLLQSDQVFALPEALRLPPSFIFWGIVFFVLGYLLYGSLLAGLGALVPNLREASQASFIVSLPLFIPFLLVSVLIEKPNSTLAVGLSLFPFSAPVAMMTRLAAARPPVWQPAAASLLILISILLVIRSVARLFRAQVLMTGQPFKLSLYFKALLKW